LGLGTGVLGNIIGDEKVAVLQQRVIALSEYKQPKTKKKLTFAHSWE